MLIALTLHPPAPVILPQAGLLFTIILTDGRELPMSPNGVSHPISFAPRIHGEVKAFLAIIASQGRLVVNSLADTSVKPFKGAYGLAGDAAKNRWVRCAR